MGGGLCVLIEEGIHIRDFEGGRGGVSELRGGRRGKINEAVI